MQMKRFFSLSFFPVFLAVFLLSTSAVKASGYWVSVAAEVAQSLEKSSQSYQAKSPKEAKRAVINAYFGIFEGKKMEAALRMEKGAKHAYRVEKQFSALRKMIKQDVPGEDYRAKVMALIEKLSADAAELDAAGISADVFNPQ